MHPPVLKQVLTVPISRVNTGGVENTSDIGSSCGVNILIDNGVQGPNEGLLVVPDGLQVAAEPGEYHLHEMSSTRQFFNHPTGSLSGKIKQSSQIYIPTSGEHLHWFRFKIPTIGTKESCIIQPAHF